MSTYKKHNISAKRLLEKELYNEKISNIKEINTNKAGGILNLAEIVESNNSSINKENYRDKLYDESTKKGKSETKRSSKNYKTSLCEKWRRGQCKFGVACTWAHGEQERRGGSGSQPVPYKVTILQVDTNKQRQLLQRLENLMESIQLSESDLSEMTEVCQSLRGVLIKHLPNFVRFQRFGSSLSGFGLHGCCDLDIFIETDDVWGIGPSETMAMIAKVLKDHPRFTAESVPQARIPIVKVMDQVTGIRCDLSAASVKGVHNSWFLKFCSDYDYRVRRLVMIVKYFASRHQLTGSGLGDHLNNYTLVLIVVFYLIVVGVLPPLHVMQRLARRPIVVDGYQFAFCTDRRLLPKPRDSGTVATLLHGFFNYYSSFPFGSMCMSPLMGEPVPINDPWLRAFYCAQLAKSGCNHGDLGCLAVGKPLVVQDPFELDRNVAQNVSNLKLEALVDCFTRAAGLLEGMLDKGNTEVKNLKRLFQPGFLEASLDKDILEVERVRIP